MTRLFNDPAPKHSAGASAKRDHSLALGQDQAPERYHGLVAHGLADRGKGVLGNRLVGGDIIRRVEEVLVDLLARDEKGKLQHTSPAGNTRLEIPLDGPRAGARIASQCGGEPDEFRLIQVMKTLFLIRHAKSSWDDTALPDKDRPLGDRGRRDAPKMGKRLAKRDVKPDLILSSPARRALTTAEIIAKKLDYKLKDIVVDDRLYAGAVHSLLNVIHGLGDKPERVMLFGHNPELTEFAHRLSGEITHMPTCAVAEFTFSAKSWRNIGKANLARVALDYPKKKKS